MPKNGKCLCAVLAVITAIVVMAPVNAGAQSTQAQVKKQVRTLESKAHKSQSVINFFNNKGRWALFLHREKCWYVSVPKGRKVCTKARRTLAYHTKRLQAVSSQIDGLLGPTWCRKYAGNRSLGCKMVYMYWPSEEQWIALEDLWDKESNWNEYSNNSTSPACGIPQAMNNCSYGYKPESQIAWGLNYIQSRYGSPTRALVFWHSRSFTKTSDWY